MNLSRRTFFLAASSLLGMGVARSMGAPVASRLVSMAHPAVAPGPFALTELPYGYNELEPFIDGLTNEIHHRRHHGGQVSGLNRAVDEFSELADLPLEEVMRNVSKFNTSVRNNGGGHYNHDIFWKTMAPEGKQGEPSEALRHALTRDFGGVNEFREAFTRAAAGRFGSGWAWLIIEDDGKLAVTSTPNQDNPLMDIADQQGLPILGIDVWEHAYYLAYQNRRGDYIANWWRVVNWSEVSRRFESAVS